MKAALIFTGSSPLLILTSYPSLKDERFIDKLKHTGINKYIAFEIPVESARERYGMRFEVIESDLGRSEDMRILDYNGHLAFERFPFNELGEMITHEEST